MRLTELRHVLSAAFLALLVSAGPAGAFSSGSSSTSSGDADLKKADAALEDKRFDEAVKYYKVALDRDPENADAWSQTGFALRKLGKFDEALDAYEQALEIAPFHLGANEYLGELYLQTDQPDKAQEMADILERACGTGCKELDALTKAIEAYRTSGGAVKWVK